MNPFKKGDVVEVVESWGTTIIDDGEVYTVVEDDKYWVRIECPTVADGYVGGWEPSRFKLVQAAPPKPPSFKDFLSPMCRVEIGRGDKYIFIEATFINNDEYLSKVDQYEDTGCLKAEWVVYKGFDIVRIFSKPNILCDLLNPHNHGELLWECHEIASKRKEKDEKIAFKQIEINMAQRKLDELVKQLKEIG